MSINGASRERRLKLIYLGKFTLSIVEEVKRKGESMRGRQGIEGRNLRERGGRIMLLFIAFVGK